ncbi:hypothetical protein [Schlesneria sp. DSM 10557]|uniref:hypothetical protein n=1 Tax=Schlesneria sp. DSM 10557 TaxID=3044399 RepID=UPI0035A00D3C
MIERKHDLTLENVDRVFGILLKVLQTPEAIRTFIVSMMVMTAWLISVLPLTVPAQGEKEASEKDRSKSPESVAKKNDSTLSVPSTSLPDKRGNESLHGPALLPFPAIAVAPKAEMPIHTKPETVRPAPAPASPIPSFLQQLPCPASIDNGDPPPHKSMPAPKAIPTPVIVFEQHARHESTLAHANRFINLAKPPIIVTPKQARHLHRVLRRDRN